MTKEHLRNLSGPRQKGISLFYMPIMQATRELSIEATSLMIKELQPMSKIFNIESICGGLQKMGTYR